MLTCFKDMAAMRYAAPHAMVMCSRKVYAANSNKLQVRMKAIREKYCSDFVERGE
jgi:hypothetical protein